MLIDLEQNGIIEKKNKLSLNDRIDPIASELLKATDYNSRNDFIPVCINGDGNCLYRAISKALYGVEDLHLEIRLRTLMEMIFKRNEIIQLSKSYFEKTDWFTESCG